MALTLKAVLRELELLEISSEIKEFGLFIATPIAPSALWEQM